MHNITVPQLDALVNIASTDDYSQYIAIIKYLSVNLCISTVLEVFQIEEIELRKMLTDYSKHFVSVNREGMILIMKDGIITSYVRLDGIVFEGVF